MVRMERLERRELRRARQVSRYAIRLADQGRMGEVVLARGSSLGPLTLLGLVQRTGLNYSDEVYDKANEILHPRGLKIENYLGGSLFTNHTYHMAVESTELGVYFDTTAEEAPHNDEPRSS